MQQKRSFTRAGGRALMIAAVLLIVAGAGWMGARGLGRERRICVMLCHEVERSAAPDERIVVDDRALEWCLLHAGSMELRRKIVFVGRQREAASLLPGEQTGASEFMLVTTENDALLAKISARGWVVREAMDDRPRFALGRGAVEIFFVTGQ